MSHSLLFARTGHPSCSNYTRITTLCSLTFWLQERTNPQPHTMLKCPYCKKTCKSAGGLTQHIFASDPCQEAQKKEISFASAAQEAREKKRKAQEREAPDASAHPVEEEPGPQVEP